MFIIGAIFGEIGKRLPIFNKYIGGAPVMIFLVAAYFVYAGIFYAERNRCYQQRYG